MDAKRMYIPGSEWLYFKIYSGPKTLEHFLLNKLFPLSDKLLEQKIIDKFFYIRYNDPEYHLRIRFHISKLSNIGVVMNSFKEVTEGLVDNRTIWKITIDCYNRELERYGNNTIEVIETLFWHNSSAVLNIIKETKDVETNRWFWGIKFVDMLLGQFGLTLLDKMRLFETFCNNYSSEFNFDKNLKLQLDSKVRNYKNQIEEILYLTPDNSSLNKLLIDNLNKSRDLTDYILYLKERNELDLEFYDLIGSIVHMHYNRLFRSQQRLHELVTYYVMFKIYKSMFAKIKYNAIEN